MCIKSLGPAFCWKWTISPSRELLLLLLLLLLLHSSYTDQGAYDYTCHALIRVHIGRLAGLLHWSHHVYQFPCTEVGCQASYIGRTTCTSSLAQRSGLLHRPHHVYQFSCSEVRPPTSATPRVPVLLHRGIAVRPPTSATPRVPVLLHRGIAVRPPTLATPRVPILLHRCRLSGLLHRPHHVYSQEAKLMSKI